MKMNLVIAIVEYFKYYEIPSERLEGLTSQVPEDSTTPCISKTTFLGVLLLDGGIR